MLIFWAILFATIAFLAGAFLLRMYWPKLQRTIAAIRDLRALLRDTRATAKILEFYGRPVVKEHFAALSGSKPEDSEPVNMSYGLSRVVGLINPTIIPVPDSDTIVCTVAIGAEFRARVAACLDSQKNFAAHRNIARGILDEPPPYMGRHAAWMKIPLIAKLLLAGYKRVLFIDADAMVTNPNFCIEDIFTRLENTKCPILVTEDEDGINSGVMFVQNINVTYRLLDLIWLNDSDINNGTWEQNSLKVLMDASNEIRSLVGIESYPKKINSFPVERRLFHPTRGDQIWSYGDFICHFSGLRTPYLERYISNYAASLQRNAADLSVRAKPLVPKQG